jgi:Peptidase family S41
VTASRKVSSLVASLLLMMGSLSASPQSIDGVWRSEGWASVYEIHGPELRTFEITTTTCVLGVSAKRIVNMRSGDTVSFRSQKGDLLYVAPGIDDQHKSLRRPGGLISITLTRLSALPLVCMPPTANTSLGNFDVFAQTFSENYIAFDLRHIDWPRTVGEQRSKVTADTRPTQLFDVMKAMIEPFRDIHTGIEAPSIKRTFDAHLRPGTDRVVRGNIDRFAKAGRRELAGITDGTYIHGRLVSYCRGQWQYGLTENGVGYLRILQLGDYSRRNGFEHDVAALNRALDQILGNPRLRSLVIDVRLSFGGDDRLGLAIAARFTSGQYVAYAIQARSDAKRRDKFTSAEPVLVKPGIGPVFTGPVVELIGPITMSAAETFTQALMGRSPHVTRIGEHTQGVFCDSLERHLPNGWTFALPNAVYPTRDKKAFDVSGIPPDVFVPVFADQDLSAGRDPAMAAALQLLAHGQEAASHPVFRRGAAHVLTHSRLSDRQLVRQNPQEAALQERPAGQPR